MKPDHWQKVDEIFRLAKSVGPEARQALILEATADIPQIRADVESLLAHDEEAGESFLQTSGKVLSKFRLDSAALRHGAGAAADGFRIRSAESDRGTDINGYRIVREMHRGGQGVIYQATQISTRREVAVKVQLDGAFASTQSRRRFEREIELVAGMRHPNIVCVFDSGISEGKHWYAMDYIHGRRLDQYVATRKLGIRDTLLLFGKVCNAVTYAHQRGVIHRDLKPNNILVDDSGEPHVLDFGLAKVDYAADANREDSILKSITGQVVGTLPYMSPEQAAGNTDQIDIRTDVYSLGVLLYELLTGQYPYDVTGRMPDAMNNIANADPRRPGRIRKDIDTELETIILKSLAKRPEERYDSAGNLADDVRRYLHGEPLTAKRHTTTYLLGRQLMRHKLLVGIAAVFVVMIVVFGISMYDAKRLVASQLQQNLTAEQREKATLEAASAATVGLLTFGKGPGYEGIRIRSLDELRQANESLPGSPMIAALRSRLLSQAGGDNSLPLRKEILDQVLTLTHPTEPFFWDELAEVSFRSRLWNDAFTANENLQDVSPNYIEYWTRKALIHLAMHEPEQAEQASIKSLENHPDYAEAWLSLACSLIQQARFDDVIFLLSGYDDDDDYDIAALAIDISPETASLEAIRSSTKLPHWGRGHWLLARAISSRRDAEPASYRSVLALNQFTIWKFNSHHIQRSERARRMRTSANRDSAESTTISSEYLTEMVENWGRYRFPDRTDLESEFTETSPVNRHRHLSNIAQVQGPGGPISPTTWCLAHLRLGNTDIAVEALRKSIEYQGENPIDHLLLCIAFHQRSRFAESESELRSAEVLIDQLDFTTAELQSFLAEARDCVHGTSP